MNRHHCGARPEFLQRRQIPPGSPSIVSGGTPAHALQLPVRASKARFAADDTGVYSGHGDDTTLGTERPSLPEWRARGW